jgi:hypothetical protein
MKKALLGCLVVTMVLMIVGGVAAYQFLYKPFVGDYVGGFTQLAKIGEMDDRVRNRSDFSEPWGGELSSEQVERFLGVQRQIKAELGKELELLEAKYEGIQEELDRSGREPDFRKVMAAWKDLSNLILEAKQIQVEALNRHGFSIAEYDWVKESVLLSAGHNVPAFSITKAAAAARDRDFDLSLFDSGETRSRVVPDRNRELTMRYVEELKETAGLAWFGL